MLMGNHDDRASFRAAFPDHAVDGAGFVQSVYETPVDAFVLIDTLDPGAGERTPLPRPPRLAQRDLAEPYRPAGVPRNASSSRSDRPADPRQIVLRDQEALAEHIARSQRVTIRRIFCGQCIDSRMGRGAESLSRRNGP